jgi:anti-anti-sigma regulatory factor
MEIAARHCGSADFGSHAVVRLVGEFDRAGCSRLRPELHATLTPFTSTVQIDTSGVTFIDMRAIRCIEEFGERAAAVSVLVLVEPVAPIMRRLLELTSLAGGRFESCGGLLVLPMAEWWRSRLVLTDR